MKRVTPFTAVRGLIATALIVLLASVVLLALPLFLVVMTFVFGSCILRSDSWHDSWEMFSSGLDEMTGDVAAIFRGLGDLWVTEDFR